MNCLPIAVLLAKKSLKSREQITRKLYNILVYNDILKSLIFLVFAPFCPFVDKNAKYGRIACQDYSSTNAMMVYIFSTSTHHFFDSQKGGR